MPRALLVALVAALAGVLIYVYQRSQIPALPTSGAPTQAGKQAIKRAQSVRQDAAESLANVLQNLKSKFEKMHIEGNYESYMKDVRALAAFSLPNPIGPPLRAISKETADELKKNTQNVIDSSEAIHDLVGDELAKLTAIDAASDVAAIQEAKARGANVASKLTNLLDKLANSAGNLRDPAIRASNGPVTLGGSIPNTLNRLKDGIPEGRVAELKRLASSVGKAYERLKL